MAVIYGTNNPDYIDTYPSTSNDTLYGYPQFNASDPDHNDNDTLWG
jgi:hypothetical protein